MQCSYYRLIWVLLLLGTGTTALAQKSVVKANLAGALSSTYTLQYEQVVSPHLSISLSGGFKRKTFKEPLDIYTAEERQDGYVVIPEMRYYFSNSENAPQGFFAGINYGYEKYSYTYDIPVDTLQTSGKVTSMRFGALLGNQWILGKHLAIELFVNPAFINSKVDGLLLTRNPARYEPPRGLALRNTRVGVCIGWAF